MLSNSGIGKGQLHNNGVLEWNSYTAMVMVDERHYGLSWVSGVDNKIATV